MVSKEVRDILRKSSYGLKYLTIRRLQETRQKTMKNSVSITSKVSLKNFLSTFTKMKVVCFGA